MFLSRVRIHIYKLNNSGKMRKHKRPRKDLLESQKGKIDTGLLSSSESLTRLSERERKYTSSSSDDDCRKTKKSRGSKGKKKDSSTSTSSSSSSTESSTSSSSSSTSSSDDNRKRKKKNMDILMRKLKQKKEDKRNNRRMKPVEKEVKKKNKTNKSKMEQLEEASNDIPLELMERSKAMAPMRKEEWEKQQNVVKRIYDEETKRHRLIKGDGEVIEEIVSKEKHRAINKQATKGDGEYFSNKLAQSIK